MKETELAKHIISYLKEKDYEVYQEVGIMGNVVDIVVKMNDDKLWAIEVKTSFNFNVLSQAIFNCHHFNYSSVFVPSAKVTDGRALAYEVARWKGVGVLEWILWKKVKEKIKAVENENILKNVVHLFENQKHYAEAGNNNGKRWSAFKETEKNIIKYIEVHPGCTFKELLEEVNTHYASFESAKNSLGSLIRGGEIKDLTISNNKLYIRNKE